MIAQGSDVRINVTVTQSYKTAQGNRVTTPVDLTAFQGYIIYLYSETINGTIIQKYSKNAATGYILIDIIDATLGQIQLWLDKSVTSVAPNGIVWGELKTSLSDTDFSLNSYYTVATFRVDKIVSSITNLVNPAT